MNTTYKYDMSPSAAHRSRLDAQSAYIHVGSAISLQDLRSRISMYVILSNEAYYMLIVLTVSPPETNHVHVRSTHHAIATSTSIWQLSPTNHGV